jgi:hypothetical protein
MQIIKYLYAALVAALAFVSISASEKKKGDVNAYLKRTGAKFLEEVAQRDGIIKLKSGMLVEILKTSTKAGAR